MTSLNQASRESGSPNDQLHRSVTSIFQSPEVSLARHQGTLKDRPNLLESTSPVAGVFSPQQSVSQASNTVTDYSKQISSISSTVSTQSEVEKCKGVIFKALNLKKNVSARAPITNFCSGQQATILR